MNRIYEWTGFIGPLVALGAITVAIALSPWFTWPGNALSDLGCYANGLPAAIVFNTGLILTGLLVLPFVYSLIRSVTDKWTKVGLIPYFMALLFLIAIGVLSEDFGRIHFYVSLGFFASFPWSMWAIGINWSIRFKELRWFGLLSIPLPLLSIYMWGGWYGGLFPFWSGNSIPEITTGMSAIGWLWAVWYLHHSDRLRVIMS